MHLTAHRHRLASEETGFTMITVMLCIFVLGLLSAAAIAAANGDIGLSRRDQSDKQAYAAAEAGVNDYLAHLSADPDYWTRCAGENSARPLTAGNAVNQEFGATPNNSATGRRWRAVPGSNSRYSIELIPRPARAGETNPPTTCNVNDPAGSMIDADGNFTIRVTGEAGETAATGDDATKGVKKSVDATFRRTSFLDYVYVTDFENMDPAYLGPKLDSLNVSATMATDANGDQLMVTDSTGKQVKAPDLKTWAADKCNHHWWGTQAAGEGRGQMPTWRGRVSINGSWYPSKSSNPPYYDLNTDYTCGEITFASADEVQGPFHSNDSILVSGSPGFGRSGRNDRVESPGFRPPSATPEFRTASGKLNTQAGDLSPPPTNDAIKEAADPAYVFTGPTTVTLNQTTIDVKPTLGGATRTLSWPANGVLYVDNVSSGGCAYGYQPQNPQNIDSSCGQLRIQGTYNKDLTVAAKDDVVITGDVTRGTGSDGKKVDAVMGIVADKFVRVNHPTCDNAGAKSNLTIDAGIMAVNHSFTVDNYNCGDPLGNLNITGAIAQSHRGVVGTGGSSITSGYVKNYTYDDRFQYRSPPYFLDPVQAAWRVVRQNEEAGAR